MPPITHTFAEMPPDFWFVRITQPKKYKNTNDECHDNLNCELMLYIKIHWRNTQYQ